MTSQRWILVVLNICNVWSFELEYHDGLLALGDLLDKDIFSAIQNASTDSLVNRIRRATPYDEEQDDNVRGQQYGEKEFLSGVKEEISRVSDDFELPAKVTYEERRSNPKGDTKSLRPLDARVKRYQHKDKIVQSEPDGCGSPVCTIIDSRPMRFPSMCGLVAFMKKLGMVRRVLHVQKGDCADAIEGKGHSWTWSQSQSTDCGGCVNDDNCHQSICVAIPNQKKAFTFENVCKALGRFGQQSNVVTVYLALGHCRHIFGENAQLKTEWFDIDDPCMEGDTESAAQNLALAATYPLTGRWRMCPKIFRTGTVQFQTIEGQPLPKDQVLHKDYELEVLKCKNADQVRKPGPPNLWFHRKILCRDYKIRHTCRCLFGCSSKETGDGTVHDVSLPPIKHLFEECHWQPFVSNETPQPDTWDGEDRASAIKSGLSKHVCGGKPFDAMYIDARKRNDDTPWNEAKEIITKNTPIYGFLCIQKNNQHFGKKCSDYKVRYCCLKAQQAQWGEWSAWSQCSKKCGGGTKTRDRVCEDKGNKKETCFGNWIDKDDYGKDRNLHLKKQTVTCNEIPCPEDAMFTEWLAWEACVRTCGKDKRRRRRGCNPSSYGGKECPTDRSRYEQWTDCKNPPCADPMWTAWSEWTKCSRTCGVGRKRKTRRCEDLITRMPMSPGLDCIGGSTDMEEDCKLTDCPIDGSWTVWQTWSTCSVLCGDEGFRTRKRYCTNPLPQFGGKKCPGNNEDTGPCEDLKPCPVHCEWSLWGEWTPCSVTCGTIGQGLQERNRHMAIEAKYGGRKCTGKFNEKRTCFHQNMSNLKDMIKKGEAKMKDSIYFCPVDCIWAKWGPWTPCPDCYGETSGIWREELSTYVQSRTRRVLKPHRFRGKPCKVKGRLARVEHADKEGGCNDDNVPPCPKVASEPFFGQWTEWGPCVGHCGKRGVMKRQRQCIADGVATPCPGEPEETKPCPNHCPPVGWSEWDEWTSCPVTCGTGQQRRARHCKDDAKDEMKGMTTCKGSKREQRLCDMGKCGSSIGWETAGSDPLKELQKRNDAKNQAYKQSVAKKDIIPEPEPGLAPIQNDAGTITDGFGPPAEPPPNKPKPKPEVRKPSHKKVYKKQKGRRRRRRRRGRKRKSRRG